jgi:hypothetical protein
MLALELLRRARRGRRRGTCPPISDRPLGAGYRSLSVRERARIMFDVCGVFVVESPKC